MARVASSRSCPSRTQVGSPSPQAGGARSGGAGSETISPLLETVRTVAVGAECHWQWCGIVLLIFYKQNLAWWLLWHRKGAQISHGQAERLSLKSLDPALELKQALSGLGSPALLLCLEIIDLSAASGMDGAGTSLGQPLQSCLGLTELNQLWCPPPPKENVHGQTWVSGEEPPSTPTWYGRAVEGWEGRTGCLWLGFTVRRGVGPWLPGTPTGLPCFRLGRGKHRLGEGLGMGGRVRASKVAGVSPGPHGFPFQEAARGTLGQPLGFRLWLTLSALGTPERLCCVPSAVLCKPLCCGGYFLRWNSLLWRLETSWFGVGIPGKGVRLRCGDTEPGRLGERADAWLCGWAQASQGLVGPEGLVIHRTV